jgi:2-succinyl-5-enolpyruvyl-6-hydroxy-3-cyclohexene-1-carboxylate synthase
MKPNSKPKQVRYTEIPLPQAVVFYCEQYGIEHVVISAGSRNAPLTNGFTENSFFKTYSIVDERAAAFFALGMAQQLDRPVAIVCTSGSALLNYYPAVAEAYYSGIPLVILSADRMPHRIGIGDGQTIEQEGVFGPHLLSAASLLPDVSHATETLLKSNRQTFFADKPSQKEVANLQEKHQAHNIAELQRVFTLANHSKGPVHLNIPMEEPLYGMTTTPIAFPKPKAKASVDLKTDIANLQSLWDKAKRKMILVGVSKPNAELSAVLSKLLKDPTVVVLTEKTSNFSNPKAVGAIDCLMAPLELEPHNQSDLQPDLLITTGGMVVSKKIKFFLREHKAKHHFHLGETSANDTFFYLTTHLDTPVAATLNSLKTVSKGNYQPRVLSHYNRYLQTAAGYLKKVPFSDLRAFDMISSALPQNVHLQIANSSPVRYIQLFDLPTGTEVFCNRGTAGIDGSTATAMGAAQINPKQTVLITGDLSFFYDVNGLWNNYIPRDTRIIVINNQGGGIFRILPGDKDTSKYDTYFETIHNRNARNVAKSFGLGYKRVQTKWGLKQALKTFLKPGGKAKILEICTPRKTNNVVLLNYFKAMVTNELNQQL